MKSKTEMVAEFMKASGGQPIYDWKDIPPEKAALWGKMIVEEAKELEEALNNGTDIVHIAKEAMDVLYVAYGIALRWGIPHDPAFVAVHASNMTKFGPNGEVYKNEEGKTIKGPFYRRAEPMLAKIMGTE